MKLKQYLYSQLAITFFPIFLGLYFITSIIFLVKIASLTSIIQINFYELFLLYSYVIPQIIFYTMPISFFISLVITLSKLSGEYELTVITSFGLNPVKILRVFLPITLFLSVALLVISIGLIPKAKFLTSQLLDAKKKEANFNIKASEFGQKFGDWLIYISEKNDKTYTDVKLFQTQDNQDQFITAKKATLKNENGNLNFRLFDGKSFHIEGEEFNQIDYKSMDINDSLANRSRDIFTTSYEYWKKELALKKDGDTDKFILYILISIFPFISLFLVITFGYFNPRYEKGKAVQYSILAIVCYYFLVDISSKRLLLYSLALVPTLWIISSYLIYIKTIKKQY